ncbi:hypothetical protein [Streptomyces werraensis]|uniref:hypothetical protein n=1 Tax=Streptomyces werraensis TaxID=68284 RepID=UPI0036B15542
MASPSEPMLAASAPTSSPRGWTAEVTGTARLELYSGTGCESATVRCSGSLPQR